MKAMDVKVATYFKYIEQRLTKKSYRLEYTVTSFISRRLFSSVEVIGLERLIKQRRAEAALGAKTINIYIARHLSEFDWQEIQRVLAGVNMMAAIQAGDNLFIGPLDPLLRHHGAFKVFRDQATIFSEHWLANSIYKTLDGFWNDPLFKKFLPIIGLKRRQPVTIDSALAKEIYVAYMKHLIEVEGRDILIFPEYLKLPDKKVKYGRSYSGKLLEFTPLIFKLLRDINKKTERRLQIVPVNASYERVVEDQSFRTLEKMKSNKFMKRFVYLVDYFFNYTHWIYQRRKGRVVIKFGEPEPLRKTMDFKMRLHDDIRKKVGQLQAVFPTQIIGYAFHDKTILSDVELVRRVEKTMAELKKTGADLRHVEKLSTRQIIQSAYDHFDLHQKRRLLIYDGVIKIHRAMRPDVLSQYRNHIVHMFEKWYEPDQLMKIIDIFRDGGDAETY
jgi:glycerol-3-phosphate O-acyltransferase